MSKLMHFAVGVLVPAVAEPTDEEPGEGDDEDDEDEEDEEEEDEKPAAKAVAVVPPAAGPALPLPVAASPMIPEPPVVAEQADTSAVTAPLPSAVAGQAADQSEAAAASLTTSPTPYPYSYPFPPLDVAEQSDASLSTSSTSLGASEVLIERDEDTTSQESSTSPPSTAVPAVAEHPAEQSDDVPPSLLSRWFCQHSRITNLLLGFVACVLLMLVYLLPLFCFLSCDCCGESAAPCYCQTWAHPFNFLCSALNPLTYGGLNRHFRESAKRLLAKWQTKRDADDTIAEAYSRRGSKRFSLYP